LRLPHCKWPRMPQSQAGGHTACTCAAGVPVKPHSSPGKGPRLHSSTISRSPAGHHVHPGQAFTVPNLRLTDANGTASLTVTPAEGSQHGPWLAAALHGTDACANASKPALSAQHAANTDSLCFLLVLQAAATTSFRWSRCLNNSQHDTILGKLVWLPCCS
jgi:hypothetical protein